MLERRGEEMPFHVMHADHRNSARERERLGVAHADEQRADEAGRVRHGDRIDGVAAGVGDRALDDGHDRREVRARRDLGHDAAKDPMHVLRQDDERLERDVVTRSVSTAADVSSHDVSMPRIRISVRGASDDEHLDLRRSQSNAGAEPRRIELDEMRQRIGEGNRRPSSFARMRSAPTRWRGPVTSTVARIDAQRERTGGPFAVAMSIAERTGTCRVHVDSKRSVTLRG